MGTSAGGRATPPPVTNRQRVRGGYVAWRLRHDLARRGIFVTTSENEPTIIDYKILKAEWEAEKAERAAEIARVRDLARADDMHPLIRLLERRIARLLSDTERTSLSARFDLVGPERLGDVVLDLSPDALAAWIADPDAR